MQERKTRSRLRRVALWLGLLLLIPSLLAGGIAGYFFVTYWPTLPEVPDVDTLLKGLPGVTRVYDSHGVLLAEFAEQYREPIPYERIPQRVIQALVAAEDQHFFEHGGVDYSGLVRAALEDLRAGR